MIQSNELRIGNFLYCQGEIRKIVGISEDVIVQYLMNNDVYYCGFDEIEPIELTEEILLKCGFKKLGSVFCISERCVVDTSENRISFYIDRIEEDIDLDLPKHLHQLQNLYFALTGEELNILFN